MGIYNRLPDDSVNVSDTHPLKEAATLIFGMIAVSTIVFIGVAFFVEIAVPLIPIEMEAKLFGSGWDRITSDMEEEENQQAEEVQALLDRLAAHWPENPYDYEVGIIPGPPNALALPGGRILVTSELLALAESENELAFVLGHELGHFHDRDHLRMLGRGALFSLLLATAGLGDSNTTSLLSLGGTLTDRSFSRDQERDADLFGLELVTEEYGYAAGSDAFFHHIQKMEQEGLVIQFASTHPLSDRRIDFLRETSDEMHWKWEGPLLPPIAKSSTPSEDDSSDYFSSGE